LVSLYAEKMMVCVTWNFLMLMLNKILQVNL
jgi:hypothetical protein